MMYLPYGANYLKDLFDAIEWDKENHPRDSKGRFTSNVVRLSGNELGQSSSPKELRDRALLYAANNFKEKNSSHPKKIKNIATGNEVALAMTGVRHTLKNAGIDLIKTIPAIPKIIENCRDIEEVAVRDYDEKTTKVEHYKCSVQIANKTLDVIMVIKQDKSGYRYYDHGIMRNE